jgi:hypothetical protein
VIAVLAISGCRDATSPLAKAAEGQYALVSVNGMALPATVTSGSFSTTYASGMLAISDTLYTSLSSDGSGYFVATGFPAPLPLNYQWAVCSPPTAGVSISEIPPCAGSWESAGDLGSWSVENGSLVLVDGQGSVTTATLVNGAISLSSGAATFMFVKQ